MASQHVSKSPAPTARAKIGEKTFSSPVEQTRGLKKLLTASPVFRGLMNTVKKYQENQGNGQFLNAERFANEVVLADKKLAAKLKQLGVTAGVQLVAFAQDSMTSGQTGPWKP